MPGRTQRDADEAFLAPLRRALSCITTAQLFVSAAGEVRALLLTGGSELSGNDLRLRSTVLPGGLLLRLRQQFRSVADPDAPVDRRWRMSTLAYDYRLSRGSDGIELLSWHWHPQTGVAHPHLHVSAAAWSRRTHVPSGRVSVEAVLRLLLTELGVVARRDDWAAVLADSEGLFIKHRHWHG